MSIHMPDLTKLKFYNDDGESPNLKHSADVRHIVKNALAIIFGWNGLLHEEVADRRRAMIYAKTDMVLPPYPGASDGNDSSGEGELPVPPT